MAHVKLNTIQIVLMARYEKLLIQIIHMAHICENDMILIKDMFQIVATCLQFILEIHGIQKSLFSPKNFQMFWWKICFLLLMFCLHFRTKYSVRMTEALGHS